MIRPSPGRLMSGRAKNARELSRAIRAAQELFSWEVAEAGLTWTNDHPDLRGHQPNPAHGDGPRPAQGLARFTRPTATPSSIYLTRRASHQHAYSALVPSLTIKRILFTPVRSTSNGTFSGYSIFVGAQS
jgi:hypothetical protein